MIPLRDENLNLRFPLATVLLLLANVATWILVQGAGFQRRTRSPPASATWAWSRAR